MADMADAATENGENEIEVFPFVEGGQGRWGQEWITVREAEELCHLPRTTGYALVPTAWKRIVKRFGTERIRVHKASLLALPPQEKSDGAPTSLTEGWLRTRRRIEGLEDENKRLREKLRRSHELLRAAAYTLDMSDTDHASQVG